MTAVQIMPGQVPATAANSPDEHLHLRMHMGIIAPQMFMVQQLQVKHTLVAAEELLVSAFKEQPGGLRTTVRIVRRYVCKQQRMTHSTPRFVFLTSCETACCPAV